MLKVVKMQTKDKVTALDLVDQANLDLGFVRAVIDVLYEISGSDHLDEIKSASISALCSESFVKIESLKKFIDGANRS